MSGMKRGDSRRRAALYDEQDGHCFYCSTPMMPPPFPRLRSPFTVTLEHLVPFAEGGRRGFPNEVAACNGCNNVRGTMSWLLFYCLKEPERLWRTRRAAA